jgi:hypothetical protein
MKRVKANIPAPKIEDGEYVCQVPNCVKRHWANEKGYQTHWAMRHGPNSVRAKRRNRVVKKARAKYQAKPKVVIAKVEPQVLEYVCPVCHTPQGPIQRGILEALKERIQCNTELTH